jgi:hypothetical protein
MLDSVWLSNIRTIISYLPVGLYAESLRFNSALISAIGSSLAIPLPLTGCIKDLSRIWHISPSDVLSDFRQYGGSSVASLRHGNSFPLVNKALLDRASITSRGTSDKGLHEIGLASRVVRLHITYIVPTTSRPSHSFAVLVSRIITAAELVILIGASTLCFRYGLTTGAVLLLCLATNVVLLLLLQHFTIFIFANKEAIEKDISLTARGAALDVHVVVEDWNALDIDVIVGYSSQLHALTNIPVRIKGWRAVIWVSRLISLVLIVQASVLATLLGESTDQVWGSIIWLFCYLFMLVSSFLVSHKNLDMLVETQPAEVMRLPPINFLGRKAALIFIATLPGIDHKFGVGRWDWMDGFMPNNERRKDWLAEVTVAELETDCEGTENGSIVSEDTKRILTQVHGVRNEPVFKRTSDEFMKRVGLYDT